MAVYNNELTLGSYYTTATATTTTATTTTTTTALLVTLMNSLCDILWLGMCGHAGKEGRFVKGPAVLTTRRLDQSRQIGLWDM